MLTYGQLAFSKAESRRLHKFPKRVADPCRLSGKAARRKALAGSVSWPAARVQLVVMRRVGAIALLVFNCCCLNHKVKLVSEFLVWGFSLRNIDPFNLTL